MKAIRLLPLLLLIGLASATSTQIASLLGSYNVSLSTISALTGQNITYNGHTYTELFLNSQPYLLINTSNPSNPIFVFKTSDISAIITNVTLNSSVSSLGISSILSEITSYLNSSSSSINDCLVETGLDRATCTVSNYCNSCALVPSCNKVLYALGGPTDTFGTGIMTFEQQYNQLQSNESILNGTGTVSASNLISSISKINFAFSNISAITQSIYENPLFPPLPSDNLSQCSTLGTSTLNVSLQGAPWYCNAVGYCLSLTYNYTQLAVIQSLVGNMNQNAPTSSYVVSIAQSINKTEESLIVPLLNQQKTRELAQILNTTLLNYNATVNKSTVLLSHIQNYTISEQLQKLESDYFGLKSGYLTLNLTSYSTVLSSDMANLSSSYSGQEALYQRIVSKARNNTGLLIALQGSNSNPDLAALAFRQDQLNAIVSSKIGNSTSLIGNLTIIGSQATAYEGGVPGFVSLARGIDGPVASGLAHAMALPYSGAVASIPLFSTIPSIIIGIIILLVILTFYLSLKKSKKLRMNPSTTRAWYLLFAIVIVLVLVYIILTYYYASVANSQAPLTLFINATRSSSKLGIVLNGTTNPSMINCANLIYNESKGLGKTPVLAYISGNVCTEGNNSLTSSSCLNSFVDQKIPFIMLTNSNTSSIRAYSMYGTALYASGGQQFMNSCYPSFFLR